MKRPLILFVLFIGPALISFAQLPAPNQIDTLYIQSLKYNFSSIKEENWPCKYIVKSTTSFLIAGQKFEIKSVRGDDRDTDFFLTDNNGEYVLSLSSDYSERIKINFSNYQFVCTTKRIERSEQYYIQEETPIIPFQLVEQKPKFNGGDANEFSKWVNKRLSYPEECKKDGIQGRVITQFTIDKDGNVNNVKVVRGVHPSLDQEAIKIISMSPKWESGKQRGQTVAVTYTFPVIFQSR